MRHTSVASSNLCSVGYENGTLEITFKSGATYQYFSVPEGVYNGLLSAPSKGGFHARYIKNKYIYRRVY